MDEGGKRRDQGVIGDEQLKIKESKETLEHIPTPEEVLSIFERLLEGREYETSRHVEDEKGLYLSTIKIDNENDEGYTEYEYMRKGEYEQGEKHGRISSSDTAICVAFFDEDDFPVGGHSVAKCIDGQWKLTP